MTQRVRIAVAFAWYDLWVGVFWSRAARTLYFCPLPMLLFSVKFRSTPAEAEQGVPLSGPEWERMTERAAEQNCECWYGTGSWTDPQAQAGLTQNQRRQNARNVAAKTLLAALAGEKESR